MELHMNAKLIARLLVGLLSAMVLSCDNTERAVKSLEEIEGVTFARGPYGKRLVVHRPWNERDSKKLGKLLQTSRPELLEIDEADPEKRPKPDFENLEFLKDLGEVDSITAVRLLNCRGIESVEGLERLPALESLSIERFVGPFEGTSVPNGLSGVEVPSLRFLRLFQVREIGALDLRGFPSLEGLSVSEARLSKIIGLEHLSSLDQLALSGCDGLTAIDSGGSQVVKEVVISNCHDLELVRIKADSLKIPHHQAKIRGLDLSGSTALQDLEFAWAMPNLERIDLSGCTALRDVTDLGGLTSLRSIDLSGCTGLRDVSALGGVSTLRSIDITGCTALPEDTVTALKRWHPDAEIMGGEE